MVLIILTEQKPLMAVETVIRRCDYVLLPFSALFIKYYPEYGKVYDEWTGFGMYTGDTNKNLGHCFNDMWPLFTWRVAMSWGKDLGLEVGEFTYSDWYALYGSMVILHGK